MRALKLILGSLVVVILILLVGGVVLPKEYRVERSIMVEASPGAVFYQVDNPGRWEEWFPWFALDSERNRSGPYSGVGAKVTWIGEDSPAISRTITFSERESRIETKLDLGEMGEPNGDWSIESTDSGARVVWGINGVAPGVLGGYFARAMDSRFGPDMEEGLARLKVISEGFDHGDPMPTLEEVIDSDLESDAAIPVLHARGTSDAQPNLDSGGGFLTELHVCVGLETPEKCKRGALLFKEKCDECHFFPAVRERSGPTLVGLVGRERRFVNGRSLVADRSYIRRSIVDHNSDDEYVPGYSGSLFDKTQILSRPEVPMRPALRSAEASTWNAAVGRLSRDDVDALVSFIEWLSPGTWPQGSVKIAEIEPGKAAFDAECIREQIELRLESIHVSYEILLEGQPDLAGEVTVQFMGLPGGSLADGKVVHDTVRNPILTRCVADAVGDATASCPVPPTDGTVTFVFARDEDAPKPPPNAIPLRLLY